MHISDKFIAAVYQLLIPLCTGRLAYSRSTFKHTHLSAPLYSGYSGRPFFAVFAAAAVEGRAQLFTLAACRFYSVCQIFRKVCSFFPNFASRHKKDRIQLNLSSICCRSSPKYFQSFSIKGRVNLIQSGIFGRGKSKMEARFEPVTSGFASHCLTYLANQILENKCNKSWL